MGRGMLKARAHHILKRHKKPQTQKQAKKELFNTYVREAFKEGLGKTSPSIFLFYLLGGKKFVCSLEKLI
jgi:hypothetical protein